MSRKDFRICKWCSDQFDALAPDKIQAGGYINECPSCVEERGGDNSAPKYLGVTAGSGKMQDITILSFADAHAREQYKKMWQANTGLHKGKSCQIGRGTVYTGGVKFTQVAENIANQNHKGKS